jgi:exodeoxyribonuclease V alpha subunit
VAPLLAPAVRHATAALLMFGDVDQLSSVGPREVLIKNVIASGEVPMIGLTEIFRQTASSQITVNAQRINAGGMPEMARTVPESDAHFVEAPDPETAALRIVALVKELPAGEWQRE